MLFRLQALPEQKENLRTSRSAYFKRLKEDEIEKSFPYRFWNFQSCDVQYSKHYRAGAIVGSAFINLLKDSKNVTAEKIHLFIR